MSDNNLNPEMNYFDNPIIQMKFDRNCLKQEKVKFIHKQVVNIYITYEKNVWPFTAGQYFTLESSLFGLLGWQHILILISVNILMRVDIFRCLMLVGFVKTLLIFGVN